MPHLELPDVSLYYEDTGGEGQPLLLLPGLATDSGCWAGCRSRFDDRFRLIMPDPRGAGRTVIKTREPLTLRAMAGDYVALLRELKINRAHVLGHSMGGMAAMAFAHEFPNFVNRLVLAGTGSRLSPFAQAVVETWGRVRERGDDTEFFLAVLPWMVTPRFYDDAKRPDSALRYYQQYPYKGTLEGFRAQMAAMRGQDRTATLAALACQAMVIAGECDLLFPPAQQRYLTGEIRNAQLRLLPGTAHSPLLENTAAFTVMVQDFLLEG